MEIRLKNDKNVIIPVCLDSFYDFTIDKRVSFENRKYGYKNDAIDYEKIKFRPIGRPESIRINLCGSDGSTLNYSDLSFEDDDLFFRKNVFTNSRLRVNFFDEKTITDQRLMIQKDISFFLQTDNFDNDGNLLDVTTSPIYFEFHEPNKNQFNSNNTENYNLFFFNFIYGFPFDMWATFEILNSKNGTSYKFAPINGIVNLEEFHTEKYVNYRLNKIGDNYFYEIPNEIKLYLVEI